MNTKLSFRPQWSKRAMALVVAAAPLQWAFASATQSSALSQNSPFNNQAPASVVQTDKTHSVKGHVADETGEPLIGATVADLQLLAKMH